MSALCGFFGLPDVADAQSALARMAHALSSAPQAIQQWQCGAGAGLAAYGRSVPPSVFQQDGCAILLLGRASLQGCAEAVAQRLLPLWRSAGPSACQHLTGSFALCIIDSLQQQLLLAIDRAGVQSLHYQAVASGVLFASNARALQAHPRASGALDRQALLDYLYFHMVPAPSTVYLGQQRLPPAGYLHFRDGALVSGRYWQLHFQEADQLSFAEQREGFLQTLRRAVDASVTPVLCGSFLSGGTDSSTLTGMLAASRGAPPHAYSIGFDVAGYDEMAYARLAARHFGAAHHERYVSADDVVQVIPRIASAADQPFGNASVIPAYYCAQMAADDGVQRLLGGDGGDELFGGNARYAQQAWLARYERLPVALRQFALEPLLFGLAGKVELAAIRKLRRYITQALMPMPARMESYNLLYHYGPAQVLDADFLASVDVGAPQRQLHACYWQGHGLSQLHRMQTVDMHYTLADNDLRKVTLACDLARVDVAFPFLSDDMLAFSASLPSCEKLRGTRLRYFFKNALADFLPAAILRKKKHGFGLPVGHWLQTDSGLRELALDSLNDLKRRRLLRPQFIDQLSGQLLAEHPAYHGTMIWVLLMLEQWLASSAQTARYQC